jgi:ABC-type Zn uptake system ZnuABC Zn-binding protein ZnuA/ABC-type Mn2+/Zn2+ transport system permease subunit
VPGPFHLAFMQRGLVEVLVLAVAAGLLGTWIVLRELAFFSHATGTAAFPGLVLADGLAFPAPLGAFATAVLFAGGVGALSARRRTSYDSLTAIVLVGFLAAGVILASDVFRSGSNVETLLFGSLLTIGWRDIALACMASGLTLAASLCLGRRWLASGFDPESARSLGLRARALDPVLLALIALSTIAALSAVGALLATALFVVPAATTRLFCRRLVLWQAATVALVAAEGVAGLWLSYETNAPPGATIAVLAGAGFLAALLVTRLPRPRVGVAAGACLALALPLVAGCGAASTSSGAGARLAVMATTTQIADWVRQVGGERVDVHQVLQPNTDPHDYEPRPRDVEAAAGARLVFLNGDRLDAWAAKLVEQSGGSPGVVDLGAVAPVRLTGESSGPEASRYDPHWWHDPVNAEAAVRRIRDALAGAAPEGKAAFEQNAARYLGRLRALDRTIAGCFGRVPSGQRKLVTDHDAFGYFARRYGIRVIGAVIPSQTTQAQPSAGDVARLSALIRREGVRAVFPESSVNPKLAQAIADQTGASAGYTLYGDTLGPAGSDGASYLQMEAANADAMVRGFSGGRLRCRVPGLS